MAGHPRDPNRFDTPILLRPNAEDAERMRRLSDRLGMRGSQLLRRVLRLVDELPELMPSVGSETKRAREKGPVSA